ncbi:MAG: hypothetical protein IKP40_06945 [Clostridia bacterium]|nr:hypothetical protein [Clostridia bacterium]
MADLGTTAKNALMKAMEGISSAASNVANNTRFKINEMNLTNQRREILESLGVKAYELFKAGAAFPPELTAVLERVAELDKELDTIRTEHMSAAKEEVPERAPTLNVPAGDSAQEKAVVAGETDDAVPVMDMPEISPADIVKPAADVIEQTAEAAAEAIQDSREAAEKLTGLLDEIKEQLPPEQVE